MEAELCSFLALALDGWEWSASHLNHFNVRETYHSAHWTICRVDPRASLDVLEKTKVLSLSGMEPWFLHHSACGLATTMTWLTQFQVHI